MGKHLIKQGLRKCYVCKIVKSLNHDNFDYNRNAAGGFNNMCRPCKQSYRKSRPPYPTPRVMYRRNIVRDRDNKCEKCGIYNENPMFFDIDHIIPLKSKAPRKYTKEDISNPNLQVLCPNCHRVKTIQDLST